MLSIRARLTLWYSGVLFAVLVAAAIAVLSLHVRLELARLDDELAASVHTVNGVLKNEAAERLQPVDAVHDMLDELELPLTGVAVLGPANELLGSRTTGSTQIPLETLIASSDTAAFAGREAQQIRLRSATTEIEGVPYRIVVWSPMAEVEREEGTLRRALILGIPMALLLAGIGGWAVGRRSLQPLTDMAHQANAIGTNISGEALRAPHPDDELGTLASAFNGLLDRLSRSLRAQRAFMADASHQLRNPVSVVRTAADVTLSRAVRTEGEYRESLEIISRQSHRLTKMVDDMFTLALVDAESRPLQMAPIYLDEVVSTVAADARPLAAKRRIELRGETPPVDVPFIGDEHLLRQMIANLVENAIRHTREGGTIVVSLARDEHQVRIGVRDEGPGIKDADRTRIFERFVRLDTMGGDGGGGLGLPIARWIAESHGGTLDLAASGPQGSAFVITLPATPADVDAAARIAG